MNKLFNILLFTVTPLGLIILIIELVARFLFKSSKEKKDERKQHGLG